VSVTDCRLATHPHRSPGKRSPCGWSRVNAIAFVVLLVPVFTATGCGSTKYVALREVRDNSLNVPLALLGRKGPTITDRSVNALNRYGLLDEYQRERGKVVVAIRRAIDETHDPELIYALSELAYVEGKVAERKRDQASALNFFGIALTNSYDYLFSEDLLLQRNPYDPQFRRVCEIYNESLEDTLRLLSADNKLRPGLSYTVSTPERSVTVRTATRGGWDPNEFARFEFVSDYNIQTLHSRHMTYGLGVPLIAVRRPSDPNDPREKYYPDGLSYSVTALMRCNLADRSPGEPAIGEDEPAIRKAVYDKNEWEVSKTYKPEPGRFRQRLGASPESILEFYDPLQANQVRLTSNWVPLETDLTTPLAFFLDSREFRSRNRVTEGLINPNKTQSQRGLFMLEPYDPNRIPVVMVHGLWSSPLTWMDMFNDLRSYPEIRSRYQFWFYLYPSGQPFLLSATQLRRDLADMREVIDRNHRDVSLDRMVLVGHSMGGLVSRMQTIDSGDDFWQIVSDHPPENLKGPEDARDRLVSNLFFQPNQSVKRVVTIGTPHRGSDFANDYTRWLARRVISLPKIVLATGQSLSRENPGFFRDTKLLTASNAIDSLAPDSPIFPVMLRAKKADGVKFHNIIGVVEKRGIFGRTTKKGDGIVELASARMDDVESELIVNAEHTTIHTTNQAILEVRRILLEHLQEVDQNVRFASGR
jgi:pimeloyl-ACP methyl ester carboxylesterase